ncbi:MAG: hypothetical protein U0136_17510 [Bdellovibrionota bacterium]
MIIKTSCRKRRRRPTMTPRFGSSTIALEIGLLRMTLDMARELEKKDAEDKQKETK